MEDRRIERHPVWRHEITQQTWASGISTAATVACPFNGALFAFAAIINATTNNITFTVSIQDSDSRALYTSGNIADNGTTVTRLTAGTEVYTPDACSIVITPSGDPGVSGATFDAVFYGT